MKTYSNPDPRLHINLLKQQVRNLNYIRRRKLINQEFDEAKEILNELGILSKLIKRKEFGNTYIDKQIKFNDRYGSEGIAPKSIDK